MKTHRQIEQNKGFGCIDFCCKALRKSSSSSSLLWLIKVRNFFTQWNKDHFYLMVSHLYNCQQLNISIHFQISPRRLNILTPTSLLLLWLKHAEKKYFTTSFLLYIFFTFFENPPIFLAQRYKHHNMLHGI
jgi:hypothetical protein